MFKKGDIVKLKSYDEYIHRKGDIAIIVDICHGDCLIKWKDGTTNIVLLDSLIKTKVHNLKDVKDKIKVGMIIACNGDGVEKITDKMIIGKVGEIKTYVSTGRTFFFLWNNTVEGSFGETPISGYSYSYKIGLDNKKAKIVFQKELKKMVQDDNGVLCVNCGKKYKAEFISDFEHKHYCVDCYEERFCKCAECEEIIKKDSDYKYDGEYYCETCFVENFRTCVCCESTIRADDAYWSEIREEYYCDSCFDDRFTTCSGCDCEIELDGSDCRSGSDGDLYCINCWENRFMECESCGSTRRTDDMHYDEEAEEYYCQSCYENDGRPVRETSVINVIHDYSFRPTPEFKKMKWENTLYMGLELEVEKIEHKKAALELVHFLKKENVDKHFYLKRDGSVPNGFEIVTHPFTLAYAHKELRLQKILKWMQEQNFDSENNGRCGLHIHISRDFFEDLDITKLRLFFRQNEEKLKKLAKRKGVGENFCMFETISTKDILKDTPQSGRYWALNLNSSTNTIEIRMFRGTLDAKRITALLQFVEALCYFVKDVGTTSIIIGEKEYHKNSWKLFIDWSKEQGKYETMLDYLKGEKLCA